MAREAGAQVGGELGHLRLRDAERGRDRLARDVVGRAAEPARDDQVVDPRRARGGRTRRSPRPRPAPPRMSTTRTPSASSRWASQVAFVFGTSPETTSLPIVRIAAEHGRSKYAVSSPRRAHIPGRCSPQRSRCESGAVPQLRCLPASGRRGRARSPASTPTNVSPRRKGGSRRAAAEPTSSAHSGGFLWSQEGSVGALALALVCSSLLAANAAAQGLPGHDHGRERQGHARREAGADRLALADGDRDAVRDRRRASRCRGRRPVELPGEGAAHEALRLHAERRGDRDVQARPRRRRGRPREARRRARASSASRCSSSRRRTSLADAYAQIGAARARRPGTGGAAAKLVGRMKAQIAAIAEDGAEGRRSRSPSTTSSTRRTTRRRRRRSSAASTRCSACATSPTRPTRRARATRSSRPSTSSSASPDLIVLADTKCCGQSAATRRRSAPAGARSRRSRTAASSRVSDDVASRWGPRVVDFVRLIAAEVQTAEVGG